MSGRKIKKYVKKAMEEMHEKRTALTNHDVAILYCLFAVVILGAGFYTLWLGNIYHDSPVIDRYPNYYEGVVDEWKPYYAAMSYGAVGAFCIVVGLLILVYGSFMYVKYDRIICEKGYRR